MSKVVIYARYSSSKQREESIEGQIRYCREYAEKHDMDVIHEYIDRAETGLSFDKRAEAMRMIKDSVTKGFTAVLVYKYDRFSRDQADFYNYQKILKKNGVRLISVMEDVGEGAQSTLIIGVHTAVNNYYSQELAEKTTRGMEENALKGKTNGGYRKFGYDIAEGGVYVINEREAMVVRLIFSDYINGVSSKEIIESLNDMGYRTSVGKKFTHDYINRILKSPIYYGLQKWDEITNVNADLAIIDEATFEKAQQRMSHNKQTGARARSDVHFALIDKAFCGECGQPLVADSTKKRKSQTKIGGNPVGTAAFTLDTTMNIIQAVEEPAYDESSEAPDYTYYRWYVCRGTKNSAFKNGCKKRRIPKDLLERKVVEYASTQYLTEANIRRLAKATEKLQSGRPSQTEIHEYEKQITAERSKIDNLMDMIEQGIGSKSAYERVAQAEQRIEIAERSIAKIKAENAPQQTFEEFTEKLLSIRQKMQSYIVDGKIPDNVIKEFCDIFISAVYVYDDDDDKTRVRIIFDEFECADLNGFTEAEIEMSSRIDITGSPRRRKLYIACGDFFCKSPVRSFRCSSSPQKVTLGFSARLQARSRRKTVATNLLRFKGGPFYLCREGRESNSPRIFFRRRRKKML